MGFSMEKKKIHRQINVIDAQLSQGSIKIMKKKELKCFKGTFDNSTSKPWFLRNAVFGRGRGGGCTGMWRQGNIETTVINKSNCTERERKREREKCQLVRYQPWCMGDNICCCVWTYCFLPAEGSWFCWTAHSDDGHCWSQTERKGLGEETVN